MQGDRRKKILSVASNASDGWRTTFTPFSSDQMIRNLSMKIDEIDSGSARLLCAVIPYTGVQSQILLCQATSRLCESRLNVRNCANAFFVQ